MSVLKASAASFVALLLTWAAAGSVNARRIHEPERRPPPTPSLPPTCPPARVRPSVCSSKTHSGFFNHNRAYLAACASADGGFEVFAIANVSPGSSLNLNSSFLQQQLNDACQAGASLFKRGPQGRGGPGLRRRRQRGDTREAPARLVCEVHTAPQGSRVTGPRLPLLSGLRRRRRDALVCAGCCRTGGPPRDVRRTPREAGMGDLDAASASEGDREHACAPRAGWLVDDRRTKRWGRPRQHLGDDVRRSDPRRTRPAAVGHDARPRMSRSRRSSSSGPIRPAASRRTCTRVTARRWTTAGPATARP